MKRICAAVVFVSLLHCAYAGGYHGGRYSSTIAEKKISFGFKFGLAIPLGDFANKTALPAGDSTHEHGFADNGFQFEIGITYRFAKNVGVAASMFNSLCKFDAASYTTANNVGTDFAVSASSKHFIAQYLFGPYFFFPLSDNFALESKILVGVLSSHYPDVTIASTIPGDFQAQTINHAIASGVGYTFSFGGQLKMGDYISISAAVTYSGSKVMYSGVIYSMSTPSGYGYNIESSSPRNMSLGIIGLTAGFNVNF